jgi:hypothetical protein
VARWSVASGSRPRGGGRSKARYADGQTHDTRSHVRLSAEQRCALATLATSGPDRATQAVLSSHGFDASVIAGLVNRGLATPMQKCCYPYLFSIHSEP